MQGRRVNGRISGIAHDLENTLCKMLINLRVAGNRLGNFGGGIVIPIVIPTMANKHATTCFELSNEIFTFHQRVSSASFRTPGISPLVRSRYRSPSWACRSSSDSPWVQ